MGSLLLGVQVASMSVVNILELSSCCEYILQCSNSTFGRKTLRQQTYKNIYISKNWRQSNEPSRKDFLKICVYTTKYYTVKMNQLHINIYELQKHCSVKTEVMDEYTLRQVCPTCGP